MNKQTTFISVIFLFLFGLLTLQAQNLIVNHQFDDGTNNWSTRGVDLSVDTSLNLSGMYAAKVIKANEGGNIWSNQLYQTLPDTGLMQAGKVYRLTFMGYADTIKNVSPMFQQTGTHATPFSTSLMFDTVPRIYGPFNYHCQQTRQDMILTFMVGQGAATTLYFDSIVVIELSKPEVTFHKPPDSSYYNIGDTIKAEANITDADGSIEHVYFFLGNDTIGFDTLAPFTVEYEVTTPNTYQLVAKAMDNDLLTESDSITVIVNDPPVANIVEDTIIVIAPETSTDIIGIASDSDGSVTSYQWNQLSGPAVTMVGDTTDTLSLSGMTNGRYVFEFVIIDNYAASDTDRVVVKRLNKPSITITQPVEFSIIHLDDTLQVRTNATDIDGTIDRVDFYLGGSSIGSATSDPFSLNYQVNTPGVYQLIAMATDNDDMTDSDTITITVNATPVATIAEDSIIIVMPDNSVNITGSGNDSDGTVDAYQWNQLSGPAATIADETTSTVQLSDLVVGIYQFELIVTDNHGATGSDTVVVEVQQYTNQPPTATISEDTVVVSMPDNSVNITGMGNDSDGTVDAYQWNQLSGPAVTIAGETTSTLQLSDLTVGTYEFELVVTDDKGDTGKDTVVVIEQLSNNIGQVIAEKINIYPVPANDIVYMKGLPRNTTIEIYNILGNQLIKKEHNGDDLLNIDVTNLPSGIYVIQIKQNETMIVTTNLIKK